MANAISPIRRQQTKPYLTLDEFKNAPTALDYGNLVQGGSQAAQDAELSNAILRASSWIDQHCDQILSATVDVEQQRGRIGTDGSVVFHPKYAPIVALTSLNIGFSPQAVVAVPDPSIAWIEEQQVIFPYANANLSWSSAGPLGFGATGSSRARVYVNYTYINGYFNSTIVTATAGASTLTVADGTGLVVGDQFTIFDGTSTETVTVASTYTFGSATVPLTSALAFTHTAGVAASALPAAIKEACILVTSAYLKIRGDSSLILGVTNAPGQAVDGSQKIGTDIAHAQDLLKPFRRIR